MQTGKPQTLFNHLTLCIVSPHHIGTHAHPEISYQISTHLELVFWVHLHVDAVILCIATHRLTHREGTLHTQQALWQ